MKRIILALLACSIAFAGSKTYTLNVWQPAVLAGTELKTGQYRMDVDGDKVIVKAGRQLVEANVRVESTNAKNRATTLVLEEREGKMHIREILLGGTNTRLVVN